MNNTPVIKLDQITKSYRLGGSQHHALKGISLDIHDGEFVAIMGPSGSGKSTTMHIIGALDTPTSGKYYLNEQEINKYTEDQLAQIRNREIGFVFQSFNLLPRTTVLKNVERPMMYSDVTIQNRESRVLEVLGLVRLKDKANNLSNQLSGGEIQRVAVARALIMDPSIILADEPTGNLDSKTSIEILSVLQHVNDLGRTIVLITHEPEIAARTKRIVTLKDGCVVSDKPYEQVRD